MKVLEGKTLFLDTNIYNHLCALDQSRREGILRGIKESAIIVCTVPQILGGLVAAFKKYPRKAQRYAMFLNDDGEAIDVAQLMYLEKILLSLNDLSKMVGCITA